MSLISRLPGKASRTLVDIARLASHSTCILEAEPGQVNTKEANQVFYLSVLEAEPGKLNTKEANLVFYLSVYPLFHSSI